VPAAETAASTMVPPRCWAISAARSSACDGAVSAVWAKRQVAIRAPALDAKAFGDLVIAFIPSGYWVLGQVCGSCHGRFDGLELSSLFIEETGDDGHAGLALLDMRHMAGVLENPPAHVRDLVGIGLDAGHGRLVEMA